MKEEFPSTLINQFLRTLGKPYLQRSLQLRTLGSNGWASITSANSSTIERVDQKIQEINSIGTINNPTRKDEFAGIKQNNISSCIFLLKIHFPAFVNFLFLNFFTSIKFGMTVVMLK